MRSGYWRHECVACGAIFFGARCAIACPSCHLAGLDRACGRCLVCGTKIRFYKRRRNRGPLFCADCLRDRTLATIHQCQKRLRTGYVAKIHLREEAEIVPTPTLGDEFL